MVSKEYWKGDEKLTWTSLWTNCPPSPSGHIYGNGAADDLSATPLPSMIKSILDIIA